MSEAAAGRPAATHEVTPEAAVALLARALYRVGYNDHTFGHISYRQDDGTMLVTPHELGWYELTASDVMRIDQDGSVIEGRWTVTPAITLHVELHRSRDDAVVAVHNHPEFSTVWAALGRIPPAYDQTSVWADVRRTRVFDRYVGDVTERAAARDNVKAIAGADIALLANHGVFVLGTSPRDVYFRCTALEHRARLAWRVEALGGGEPIPETAERALIDLVAGIGGMPHVWEAAVRREIDADPRVVT